MKKTKSEIQIMISGYYGFKNTGDEAILSSIVKNIRAKNNRIKMIVLSENPPETSSTYLVKSIHRMQWLQILKCLFETDIFISGGGGLLQDSTGWGLSILYYLGLIALAKTFRIPVIIYAQGIGPVKGIFNKLMIKWILNNIDLLSVRDNQSSELLKNMGIKKPIIHSNADPSFLLVKADLKDILERNPSLNKFIAGYHQPLIGISVRNCKGQSDKLKRNIAQIADFLIEEYNAKIIFIPFHVRKDELISKEIIELINMKEESYFLKDEYSPEEVLAIISRLTLVLGVRLHSLMFSCLMNIPFIAVNYDPKVENFVKNLELDDLLTDSDDLSLKNVQKKVEYIMENYEQIKNLLIKKDKTLKEKASSNNNLLFDFLNRM